MDRKRFEELVAEAYESLPEHFKERLENVDILVEDWPSPEQLKQVGLSRRDELFGLYEGVPLPKRGSGYQMVLPDRITIFRKPILMRYHSEEAIRRKVRSTLRHEIAHYFGISDQRLKEIDRY